jgi:CheY-like chemotaxis protein
LVVDDDAEFRVVVSELLSAHGFEVVGEANNGPAAIAVVERLRPTGVLLDVRLQDEDGFEVARQLNALIQPPAVLLTSSDADAANEILAGECGAVGFLPKSELATCDLCAYFSR